jgi:hypothetical protein
MIQLPYQPKFSREWIEKQLSKTHFKKPYDRFMWWRSYTPKNKPLSNRHPFRDRILNGDFEHSSYPLEVELAKHTMNSKFLACVTKNGEVDQGKYISESSIDRSRIKRLNEDYEKDEKSKLEEIKKGFLINLKMSKEDYEEEVTNTRSSSLIEFYDNMAEKYGTYWKPLSYVRKT